MVRAGKRKATRVEIVRQVSESWTARELLDGLPGPAACLDAGLRVSLANRAFADRYHMAPEDLVGLPVRDLHPTTDGELERMARRVLENRKPWRAGASSLLPSEGHEAGDEDVMVVPIGHERGGEPTGVLVFGVDARDRLRLERALRMRDRRCERQELLLDRMVEAARAERERLADEQIARMRHLDKLKTDFLAAASHELRTPLSAILGYAELLADGVVGELAPQQQQFATEIMAATGRLHRLIDDLLDFAQLESGALVVAATEVDLFALASEAAAQARQAARELGIALEADLRGPGVKVHGDARRLGRAVAHLVDNALKFTPTGGKVTIEVGLDDRVAVVAVQDSGIGIPKTHQPHVFDKFYQVDSGSTRRAGGTGIGLSLVRAIVEAHGGRVGVESKPGKGSRFWIALPVN